MKHPIRLAVRWAFVARVGPIVSRSTAMKINQLTDEAVKEIDGKTVSSIAHTTDVLMKSPDTSTIRRIRVHIEPLLQGLMMTLPQWS
jgi:hypothetical protein